MKAVLVIDVPDNILLDFSKANIEIKESAYLVNKGENEWKYIKPIKIEGISLRPLPQREKANEGSYGVIGMVDTAWTQGFNDCLAEITGEME